MALIVVIESSPLLRPALRDLLQLEGHTVLTVSSTSEAFSILKDIADVDLVIANYTLPDMDATALARRLREDAKHCAVPLLVLALEGDQRVGQRAIQAGANNCLIPPITVSGLKNAIKQMLNGRPSG